MFPLLVEWNVQFPYSRITILYDLFSKTQKLVKVWHTEKYT